MRNVFNTFNAILGDIQYLKFTVLLQVLQHLDAILRQIQLSQIDEFIEIFDFGDSIVLQAEACELRELVKILDFGNFVLAEIQLSEWCEVFEVFDFLKRIEVWSLVNVAVAFQLWNFPPTHPDLVIPELQHRQICQRSNAINAGKLVGAQVELLQIDQSIDSLNDGYPIETEIQRSAKCIGLHEVLKHYEECLTL